MGLKCVSGIKCIFILNIVFVTQVTKAQKFFVGTNAFFPLDHKGKGWEGEVSAISRNRVFYRLGFGYAAVEEGYSSKDYIKGKFVGISFSHLSSRWMTRPVSMFFGAQFIHSRQDEVYNFQFGKTHYNRITINQHKMRYYAGGINWGVSFFRTRKISFDLTHQLNILFYYSGEGEQTMNSYIFGVGTEGPGNPELAARLRTRFMLNVRVNLLNR